MLAIPRPQVITRPSFEAADDDGAGELGDARAFFCFAHAPLRVGRLALRVSRE